MNVSQAFEVTSVVIVTLDDAKFTDEFMSEFRRNFFDFDTIAEHGEHLATLLATGVIAGSPDEFVEGYGPLKDMGISFKLQRSHTEALLNYGAAA